MTKLSDHPDIIYKFRDWKNKFHRLIITRREIYFPSPKEFNDPYDCRIPESFYLLDTDEKIDKYFREFAIRNFDKLRSLGYDINKYIIHAKEDFKYCKKAYQEELNQKYLHEGDLYFGILSTSKIWNNIQMWAHYSAKHTGFCVGFDREILYENLPECNAASVHYTKKFPQIDPFDDFVQKMFQKSHTKEKNWSYEKEYRFYWNSYPNKLMRTNRKIVIPKECFNCIMLGLEFPKDQINIIKRLTDNLGVAVYQIYKDDKSYNLKRKKITF